MKNYKIFGLIALFATSIVACNNDDTSIPVKKNYTNEVGVEIKRNIDVVTTKASGDDLFAVQILEKASGESTYSATRAGLFDDLELIKFGTEKDVTYKLNVSVVKDGKNKIFPTSGTAINAPFDGIVADRTADLNTFKDNTNALENIKSGGVKITDDAEVYYYSDAMRYFNTKEDIAYDAGKTELELKCCYYKLFVRTENENVMADGSKLLITLHNGLADADKKVSKEWEVLKADAIAKNAEDAIVGTAYIRNFLNIEGAIADAYKESMKMEIKYVVGVNEVASTTIDLNDIERKKAYSINIANISQTLEITFENSDFTDGTPIDVNF